MSRLKDIFLRGSKIVLDQRRLYIFLFLFIIVSIGFSHFLFKVVYNQFREYALNQRRNSLVEKVGIAHNMIKPILEDYQRGLIKKEEALDQCRLTLRKMVYKNEHDQSYIFMNTLTGVILVRPFNPEDELENHWTDQDSQGKYFMQKISQDVQKKPKGVFTTYLFPNPLTGVEEEKLSYSILVPQLNAYIGTGTYMQIMTKEQMKLLRFGYYFFVTVIILFFIPLFFLLFYLNKKNQLLNQEIKQNLVNQELHYLNELRLESLVNLNQKFNSSKEELIDFTIKEIIKLTQSQLGCVAFFKRDRQLQSMHSYVSKGTTSHYYNLSLSDVRPLCEEVLQKNNAIIHNTPITIEGEDIYIDDIKIFRSMNVPVFDNGTICLIAGVGNKEEDYQQNDLRMVSLLLDGLFRILQKKDIEEEINLSRENLKTTLNSIGDAVVSVDINGYIFKMNDKAEEISEFKYSQHRKVKFDQLFKLYNRENHNITKRITEKIVNNRKAVMESDQISMTNRLGDKYYVSVNASPILSTSNEITGIVFAIRDVTEEVRLRQEARDKDLIFRTIFETSPFPTEIKRYNDGTYIMVNQAFLKANNLQLEEVIGKTTVETGIYLQEYPKIKEDFHKIGKLDNAYLKGKNKFGNFEIICSSRIIEINQEKCILTISSDITEVKKLQEQLNHAQKLDAVGQLAGGIAHDFNNMLGGILGTAELILLKDMNKTETEKYLNMITDAAERASELTKKLLIFSRKGKIESTANNVHKAVLEAGNLLKRSIDKRIEIIFDLQAEEYTVIGEFTQLMNVFLNLGINSGHAMPDGGKLIYRSRTVELDEQYCLASPFELISGQYILIEVEDTGTGIDSDVLPKIFEPFFTTKDQGKGTGLGLSAVYGSVVQHHGAISVYSEKNKGTQFNIYLPLSERSMQEKNYQQDVVKGSGCILVVDDEELIRIMAKNILEYLGYEVLFAENGQEAIEVFKTNKDKIDIVLMDMVMPIMNGKESFFKLKQLDPEVKVILCSGFSQEKDITEMKNSGLKGFLKKPYHTLDISKHLDKILKEYNL